MKTFTLRLTDNEAEALSRLSSCYGMSKNKMLATLIVKAYTDMMYFEPRPDMSDHTIFIYSFEDTGAFPNRMMENYDNGGPFPISERECIKRVLAAYDYALETENDPAELEALEKEKQVAIDVLDITEGATSSDKVNFQELMNTDE